MGRNKVIKRETLLTHRIGLRVTAEIYHWLQEKVKTSDCQSVAELARKIIEKKQVRVFHQDSTLDQHWEDIIRLTNEVNAIGVNINQITHFFHLADSTNQKMFHALKVAEQYSKVGELVKRLISVISDLEKKWLQG